MSCRLHSLTVASKRVVAHGYSLLETMVAVSILAIVGLGMISGVILMRHLAEFDKQRLAAVSYARSYIEERARKDMYPTIAPISAVTLDNFNTPDISDDLRAEMDVRLYDVLPDGTRGAALPGPPTSDQRVELEITISWNRTGSLSSRRVHEVLTTYVSPDL